MFTLYSLFLMATNCVITNRDGLLTIEKYFNIEKKRKERF